MLYECFPGTSGYRMGVPDEVNGIGLQSIAKQI